MVTGISMQICGSCLSYSHVNKILPKEVVRGIGPCECIGLLPVEAWATLRLHPECLCVIRCVVTWEGGGVREKSGERKLSATLSCGV